MPYLARSKANTSKILALFAVDSDGFLYDPESVEFRIVNVSDETQVFPGSGYEDVTEFGEALGVFPAWDVALNVGWTPAVDETIGAHRIEWRFTDSDGTTVRSWSQEFDVSEVGSGVGFWSYLSPNDVRNEGITTGTLSDARLVALIRRVQEYIERATRQAFRPVRTTFKVDGNGSGTLFLGVPIIGIESLKADFSTLALPSSAIRVYASPALGEDSAWTPGDNRKNPKISYVGGRSNGSIFDSPLRSGRSGRFSASTQGHEITGVFGYLERDGSTPQLIRYAALRMVLANTPLLTAGASSSAGGTGPILSETTDIHSVTYADLSSGLASGSALATSREVEEILQTYRAPIALAAPATMFGTSLGP